MRVGHVRRRSCLLSRLARATRRPSAALLLLLALLPAGAGQAAGAGADRGAVARPGAAHHVPARGEDPTLGGLVARTFLQSLSDGDVQAAVPLCADEVDFDGALRKGRKAVRAALEKMKKRMGGHRRARYVTVLSLEDARHRFGPPPSRLRLPSVGSILVGFARFRRGGLVAFVAQMQGRYRVVALTD